MLNIFPNPKTIIYEDGILEFKSNFFVEFSHEPDEEYNFGAKKLVESVKKYIGAELTSKKGEDTTVISFLLNEDLQKEEYRIDVFDEEIVIRNSGYVSAFRAVTTLNQVLRQCKKQIPQFTLADKPDIENRGIMIYVSCGKSPKIDELKNMIDYMSEIKYNQFHLYFDNNNLLIPQEIKELSAYCKERCVELVPTLNPLDCARFEQVGKKFADAMSHYESDYINVCYDEIKEMSDYTAKETSTEGIYTNFLLQIYELAKKYGKQTMFWDNRLILYPGSTRKLPRDIIPLERGYEPHSTMVESTIKFLAKEGFDFYVCPETSTQNTFLGRGENTVENQLEYAVYGKKYKALGYLLTDRGDGWHTQSPSISLISYTYGGGVSWGVDENADVSGAIKLVKDLERL